MTDNSTRVLAHGGGRYTITSALASPQDLPPGTYTPNYNKMMGSHNFTQLLLNARQN